MRRPPIALAALASLLPTACGSIHAPARPTTAEGSTPGAPSTENAGRARAALLDADRAFAASSRANGAAAAFHAYFAPEGWVFGQGDQPARGPRAIEASFADMPAGASLLWAPEEADVAASGELGWTWGRYTFTAPGPTGPTTRHGKYVSVWRKVGGVWKVVADIGNGNPPP